MFADAADVERFVDGIVGDAFGGEVAFAKCVGNCGVCDWRIFLSDLLDDGDETRVARNIFERPGGTSCGVEAGVSLGHFF